jgi:hypothetical protein
MPFLATAQHVFQIVDREVGFVLAEDRLADLGFRAGDVIQLRTPDSRLLDTLIIKGVERIKTDRGSFARRMVPQEVSSTRISSETEIRLAASQPGSECP